MNDTQPQWTAHLPKEVEKVIEDVKHEETKLEAEVKKLEEKIHGKSEVK